VDNEKTKIGTGDMIILQCGAKFQFNATKGAKILQFQRPDLTSAHDKVMELACARHPIRRFLDKPLLKKDIYYILKSGMFAPASSKRHPWKFVVVGDAEMKRNIRESAEKAEKKILEALKKSGNLPKTKDLDNIWKKPFLENAPILICVFGNRDQQYYKESLWLAIGWMLLAAEELGLSTLTYTPADLKFLNRLLNINGSYHTELIIPIGYGKKSDDSSLKKDFYDVVSWV
jgi:nitroreductase